MSVLLSCVLFVQYWPMPENLGIPGVDDINPQACRRQEEHSCVVWQSYINGNWEIFSRWFYYWPLYSDTVRVTNHDSADINPCVAYDQIRDCFWCVWQSNRTGNYDLFVSKGQTSTGWEPPYQLTNDTLYDTSPSVCVIHDTVWIAWQSQAGESLGYANIYARCYDGTDWSSIMQLTNDQYIHNANPKINGRHNHPIAVWQKGNFYTDIYYSEYISASWQTQQDIAPHMADDARPEIAVVPYGYGGVWVIWMSDRAQYAYYDIYRTAYDTLNVFYRVTYGDSSEICPSPLFAQGVIKQESPTFTAFSSNVNGSSDVYTYLGGWGWDTTIAVDTNPAQDINPVMTGGDWYVWVLWQTDRNVDWDIIGSYVYFGGIADRGTVSSDVQKAMLEVHPNPFSGKTKIKFEIRNPKSEMSLKIYDASGRLVKSFNVPSAYSLLPSIITWDGTDEIGRRVPPGVYFVQLNTCHGDATCRTIIKL